MYQPSLLGTWSQLLIGTEAPERASKEGLILGWAQTHWHLRTRGFQNHISLACSEETSLSCSRHNHSEGGCPHPKPCPPQHDQPSLNHSAPLVITPLLLGYPVLWELKGVGWGMKMGPKHLCQQVQPHLQVNKPMWALRLSQKLNTPGWTDHSNLRKEEWQIRPPNRVNQSKHRPGVCVLEKSFLLRVLSPEAHFNL